MKDTPRWALVTRDADARPAALIAGFDCAIGATLGEAKTPTLGIMPYRVLSDVEVAFQTAKAEVKRLRPPVGNDLPICVPRSWDLAKSYSYPSGHAPISISWPQTISEKRPRT